MPTVLTSGDSCSIRAIVGNALRELGLVAAEGATLLRRAADTRHLAIFDSVDRARGMAA